MNVTSNLHVTIADLKELRGWSYEEIQRIFSSYQYKSKKVKVTVTSLGMYTARKKDYCVEFECVVKDVNRLRRNLNLPTGDPLHMTVCYMTENSYIEIFQPKLESEEEQY